MVNMIWTRDFVTGFVILLFELYTDIGHKKLPVGSLFVAIHPNYSCTCREFHSTYYVMKTIQKISAMPSIKRKIALYNNVYNIYFILALY